MESNIQPVDDVILGEAATIINNGGLVAFPTETVYGLGANALDEDAVKKIFQVKGRHDDNPLIVHVATIDDVKPLVKEIPECAKKAMETFWPGPLTLVFAASKDIPKVVTGGLDTVAIRIPNHPIALALLEKSGVPIAAPSANRSGSPSPTTAQHVAHDLGDDVNLILDRGPTTIGIESTVVDVTVSPVEILRPGGITHEELQSFFGEVKIVNEQDVAKSPGMKYKHYAPKSNLHVVEGKKEEIFQKIKKQIPQKKKIAVLTAYEDHTYDVDETYFMGNTKEEIAKNLFTLLRTCDDKEVDVIFVEGVSEEGLGLAIMNRLRKAAHDE